MKREESVKGRGVEKKGEKYTRETGVGEEKRGPRGGEERGKGFAFEYTEQDVRRQRSGRN